MKGTGIVIIKTKKNCNFTGMFLFFPITYVTPICGPRAKRAKMPLPGPPTGNIVWMRTGKLKRGNVPNSTTKSFHNSITICMSHTTKYVSVKIFRNSIHFCGVSEKSQVIKTLDEIRLNMTFCNTMHEYMRENNIYKQVCDGLTKHVPIVDEEDKYRDEDDDDDTKLTEITQEIVDDVVSHVDTDNQYVKDYLVNILQEAPSVEDILQVLLDIKTYKSIFDDKMELQGYTSRSLTTDYNVESNIKISDMVKYFASDSEEYICQYQNFTDKNIKLKRVMEYRDSLVAITFCVVKRIPKDNKTNNKISIKQTTSFNVANTEDKKPVEWIDFEDVHIAAMNDMIDEITHL